MKPFDQKADLVLFLACDKARYLTATTVTMDGAPYLAVI